MAQGLVSAFESEIINYFLRNQALTYSRAQLYVALSTAAYSEAATGASMNEVAGTGYARQTVAFDAPAGTPRATQNSAPVTFTAGATWTAVVAMYICDAASGGNVLCGADITSVVLNNGDSLTFATGDIDISIT